MKNGHSKLTKAEHKAALARAERVKYNKSHPKRAARKGERRANAAPGARLAYDALGRKKK